jgi:hypothetical protein
MKLHELQERLPQELLATRLEQVRGGPVLLLLLGVVVAADCA